MTGLLVKSEQFTDQIADFGYEYLGFQARKLLRGEVLGGATGGRELAIVLLGGICTVDSTAGRFERVGAREHVFAGRPHAVYLPVESAFTVTADQPCDLAFCYAKAERPFPARVITPEDVEVEIRGGGNATRQINHIIKPDFPADRLLVVEVYTPAGNWSSYPPHKHDVHNPPGEVDLEEIYYYRVSDPRGYAIQKVYTADRRLDETITVRDGELILVPEGYHPVAAAHGYDVYYLNSLAGSARSMAASDDPDHAWVRSAWKDRDPRLPLV